MSHDCVRAEDALVGLRFNEALRDLATREERRLMALILTIKECARKAFADIPDAAWYDPEMSRLWRYAREHWRKHAALLSRPALDVALVDAETPEEAGKYRSVYDMTISEFGLSGDDFAILRDGILDRHAQAAVREAIVRGFQDLITSPRGGREIAARLVKDATLALRSAGSKRAATADDAAIVVGTQQEPVEQVVEGILCRGDIMQVVGPSKARKSFLATQLALCVSAGRPFLGIPTTRVPVAYLNAEIRGPHYRNRLRRMAAALDVGPGDMALRVVHARGVPPDEAIAALEEQARLAKAGLLVIDPVYKVMGGDDENATGAWAPIIRRLDQLAEETGAAIVYVHHSAKGSPGDRKAADRGSGSGMQARAYDAGLTLCPHRDDPDAVVLDWVVRNFAPADPVAVRWHCGRFDVAVDLAPDVETSRSRSAKAGAGGRNAALASRKAIALALLIGRTMTAKEWREEFAARLGIGRDSARDVDNALRADGAIVTIRGPGRAGETLVQAATPTGPTRGDHGDADMREFAGESIGGTV